MITEEDLKMCDKIIYKEMTPFIKYHEKEDLYQSGQVGVGLAKNSYDTSFNTKFTTHAYPWIKGEIRNFVHKDSIMRASPEMLKKYRNIITTKEKLIQSGLENPTYTDIALVTEMEEDDVDMVINLVEQTFVRSVDEAAEEQIDYYNQVGNIEYGMQAEVQDLYQAMSELDIHENQILDYRYFQGYSQQEIAEIMGMSQAKVSREENKIKQKLKSKLDNNTNC